MRRAALFGTAAAVVAAMAATFIKELTHTLSVDGPVATLNSWPLYAVIAQASQPPCWSKLRHTPAADGLTTSSGGDRSDRQGFAGSVRLEVTARS